MRKIASMVAGLALCAGVAQAQYTYVGSWSVSSGPVWFSDPPPVVYSAQEAAALLFGGAPSDYVISTNGDNVSNINFSGWYDGWGTPWNIFAQDFSYSPFDNRYYCCTTPGDFNTYDPAYSAFVSDHIDMSKVNYAFKVTATPEPGTLVLLGSGLFGVGVVVLRRRKVVADT